MWVIVGEGLRQHPKEHAGSVVHADRACNQQQRGCISSVLVDSMLCDGLKRVCVVLGCDSARANVGPGAGLPCAPGAGLPCTPGAGLPCTLAQGSLQVCGVSVPVSTSGL
jgi:hypothetical protein